MCGTVCVCTDDWDSVTLLYRAVGYWGAGGRKHLSQSDGVAVGILGSLRHEAAVSLTRDANEASFKIFEPNHPFEISSFIRYQL